MGKPSALIVEDERDIAALFRYVLDMAGFRTEIAFHGRDAVERLSHSQPNLVILDLSLPGVSGSEILESIRKDDRLRDTKVIVATAHAHIAESLSVEPDLVLFKPVSIEQLTNLVNRLSLSEISQGAKPIQEKPLDPSTGLYNQSFFMHRLDCALKQSKEIDPYLFAVLSCKLDQKSSLENQADPGRWESDLREIAESFRHSIRPTDTIARFDQDNFYILIENMPNSDIPRMIADRLERRLEENIVDIGNRIRIPIRIGILLCDRGYEDVEGILRDAKNAQSLANARGD